MQQDIQSKIVSIMSNRLEELYVHLKKQLIANQSNPFKKRFIVVPDSFVKAFLQIRLAAEETKVAIGLEILLPRQAIEQIITFSTVENPLPFSSYLDLLIVAVGQGIDLPLARQIVHMDEKKPKYAEMIESLSREESIRLLSKESHFFEISTEALPDELWLFGVSTLPESYHHFFCRISQHIPVVYFVLSPCMLFWSDICSDREVQKLKSREVVSDLALDRSVLLANCGKTGRQFSLLLEETVMHSEEAYVVHEWALNEPLFSKHLRLHALSERRDSAPGATLLSVLHHSLLCLTGKSVQKIALPSSDTTVQVHTAPSLLGEVQILYEQIAAYAGKEPLLWGEIMVLAPDIEVYRPYIERVFRGSGSVPYQILGSKNEEGYRLFSFFWKMLELPETGWSADALFDLFGCKAIRQKFGLSLEDLSGVYACMEKNAFQRIDSFDSFVNQMVYLWTNSIGKRGEFELDRSLGTALGISIHIIRSLRDAFKPMQEHSLESWAIFLEKLFNDYFEVDANESWLLCQALLIFKKCAIRHSKKLFSLSVVREFFKEAFEEVLAKEETVIKMPLVFSSIGRSSIFVSKMTCLIGMNEGKDTYHFIEAILSTRKQLHISYQRYSYEEKAPLQPSSSVLDLLQTLDDCCLVGNEPPSHHCLRHHRFEAYHPLSTEKQVYKPIFLKAEHKETVTVSYLAQVAKSPLKPYFQQSISLYLTEKNHKRLDDAFSHMESMTFSLIKKKGLRLPKEEAKIFFEKETQGLPEAVKQASMMLFEQEITELQRSASTFGICCEEPVKIELTTSCSEPCEVVPNHWKVPAISVPINDGSQVHVVGVLDDLYPQGHLFLGNQSDEALVRAWAKILLTSYVAKNFNIPVQSHCYFLKHGKERACHIEDPTQALYRYVQHAIDCKKEASCLYPEWVPKLLSQDVPPKENAGTDAYLNFFLSRVTEEYLFERWPVWKERACDLFADLGVKNHEL